MKSNLRPYFDLTETVHNALQILWYIGSACGYTGAELKDIEQRLITKARELVGHIEDEERACNPHRLVYLAMNDLRREHDRWHSLFAHRRLRANMMRYGEWWSGLESEIRTARIVTASSAS